MNHYEEKKETRIEGMKFRVLKKNREAYALDDRAQHSLSGLGMGQPILIGHHSERRHRNLLKRTNAMTLKAIVLWDEAESLASRIEAAEGNTMISSDDPEAISKLEFRIAQLSAWQENMKTINKAIKNKKPLTELGLGLSGEDAEKLITPNRFGDVGFPKYKLTNNNANINRLKTRLEGLKKKLASPVSEPIVINGVLLKENAQENRIQLHFNSKPPAAILADLKANGFHWSPYNGCWQRMRTSYALQLAKTILNQFEKNGSFISE